MPWLLMVASLVGAWRDMEIEKLPGLGASESVEAWFERTTHNKSVPDIAWWQYQQEVLVLCEPLWQLVNERKRLADYDYWELQEYLGVYRKSVVTWRLVLLLLEAIGILEDP